MVIAGSVSNASGPRHLSSPLFNALKTFGLGNCSIFVAQRDADGLIRCRKLDSWRVGKYRGQS